MAVTVRAVPMPTLPAPVAMAIGVAPKPTPPAAPTVPAAGMTTTEKVGIGAAVVALLFGIHHFAK